MALVPPGDEILEELRASYSKRRPGPIRKVIVTKYGIAAGETRKAAVPEWPEVHLDVPNRYEHLKIKAADNIAALKPAAWWERVVNEAAEELVKMGTPKEQVASRLGQDFPMSEKKVLRYLREEFKHPAKVKAGKASAEVRQEAALMVRTESQGTRASSMIVPKGSASAQGFRLVSDTKVWPTPVASEYRRGAYTPEEEMLQTAFSGRGFILSFQHPVPMNKWKCGKCRETWIEEPPTQCPKDGTQVERLNYHIDVMVQHNEFRWAVEPGGKQHDFDSDKMRDDFLRENGYEPLHFDNDLVRAGAWLIVAYLVALVKLRTYEEHRIVFEGYAKRVTHNTETIVDAAEFRTGGPAHVWITVKRK